jgi:hypothetical protein
MNPFVNLSHHRVWEYTAYAKQLKQCMKPTVQYLLEHLIYFLIVINYTRQRPSTEADGSLPY